MFSLNELIIQRRSIRKYGPGVPPAAWIEQMLVLACHAPSPSNIQPVRFIRINAPEIKASLGRSLEAGRDRFLQTAASSLKPKNLKNWINAYYRFAEFLLQAPVLLAVGTVAPSSGLSRRLAEAGVKEPGKRWETDADIAVGLALQNFILKGEELGLGSCVLTVPLVFISRIEEILGVADVTIKCLLTTGFPAEEPPAPKKKGLPDIYVEI